MWRTQKLPSFIARFYGFCQTDLGPGMLVEKIASGGQIGKTLLDMKRQNCSDPRLEKLITTFFDDVVESGCVATDLRPRNVVIGGDFERLVLVDGLGDSVLIKTKMHSRFLRERFYRHKRQEFLSLFKK